MVGGKGASEGQRVVLVDAGLGAVSIVATRRPPCWPGDPFDAALASWQSAVYCLQSRGEGPAEGFGTTAGEPGLRGCDGNPRRQMSTDRSLRRSGGRGAAGGGKDKKKKDIEM